MKSRWSWMREELARLQTEGLRRRRGKAASLAGGWCQVNGRRLRNFASNDYLDLAHDPRVVGAAQEALGSAGLGATASALVTGRSEWHVRLEERLADFENQEAALLFPTGYAANVGTISAVAGPEDVIFCDRLNHASLVDGCRLSRARLRIYRHERLERLERELAKSTGFRRRYIVTDSLFSMDGVAAPLGPLCDLAERYEALLLIDEAHATGVFGPNGRGLAEQLGVEDRVAIRVGTMSKAIGALGGFVAGQEVLIDWLWNRARTQMFSTALPAAVCAAACAALEVIEQEPERRERLRSLWERLRHGIRQAGLRTPASGIGPIIPVILDDPDKAVAAAERVQQAGFLVAAIRPPTVPAGTSRLRISVTCAHSQQEIDRLIAALAEAVHCRQ